MAESKYITLVSSDGFEFVALREATLVSPTMKGMLRSQFSEAHTGRCEFPEISAVVLEKVVEYFHYWYRNRDKEDVPDMDIPVELCLELLMAAEFFNLDARPGAMRDAAAAAVSKVDIRPGPKSAAHPMGSAGQALGMDFEEDDSAVNYKAPKSIFGNSTAI